jgi:hypothetical protein
MFFLTGFSCDNVFQWEKCGLYSRLDPSRRERRMASESRENLLGEESKAKQKDAFLN